MAYIVNTLFKIKRQTGDTTEIKFTVPEIIDLQLFDVIKFQVFNQNDVAFITKTNAYGITVAGQDLIINLSKADTTGKAGNNYPFEVEISKNNPEEVITIIKGFLTLIEEKIK